MKLSLSRDRISLFCIQLTVSMILRQSWETPCHLVIIMTWGDVQRDMGSDFSEMGKIVFQCKHGKALLHLIIHGHIHHRHISDRAPLIRRRWLNQTQPLRVTPPIPIPPPLAV